METLRGGDRLTTPYLPVPSTWSTGEIVSAVQLRDDVSGTIQLLSRPPMFIGSQTTTAQSVPGNTDTAVQLDTETADTLNGHRLTTSNATYYAMFPGWYLCEGTAALNSTGGSGSFSVGFNANIAGVQSLRYGQRIPNASGSDSVAYTARLVQMVNTGTFGSGDFIQLMAYQTASTAPTALLNGSARYPLMTCRWVAAGLSLAGLTTSSLPVPPLAPWPAATTTLSTGVSAGAVSITPASTAGMAFYGFQGTTLGLDPGTAVAENVVTTANPSGGNVPVTATQFAHAAGATVSVPVDAPVMNQNVRDTLAFLLFPPIMQYNQVGAVQLLASQTGLPAVGTAMTLNSITADNYTAFAPGSATWTVPVPGVYWCHGNVAIVTGATTVAIAAGLTVTSANYNSGSTFTMWGGGINAVASDPTATSVASAATVTRMLRLNAGDTVQLAGFQHDSGGNVTFTLGSGEWSCRLITLWRGL